MTATCRAFDFSKRPAGEVKLRFGPPHCSQSLCALTSTKTTKSRTKINQVLLFATLITYPFLTLLGAPAVTVNAALPASPRATRAPLKARLPAATIQARHLAAGPRVRRTRAQSRATRKQILLPGRSTASGHSH